MAHPRTRFWKQLDRPRTAAADLGYRLPAEWEPQARIWLSFPRHRPTWPGCLPQAQRQFRAFMQALRPFVKVVTTQQARIPTNDAWIRDYGPLFVVRQPGSATGPVSGGIGGSGGVGGSASLPPLACHDFHFNTWGRKYGSRRRDDVVPQHLARRLGIPVWVHDLVLEGGSIEVNGCGTVLTTEQCLLNPNRAASARARPRTLAALERVLRDALGAWHTIWLPGGIAGDDTDGHVDDIARFIAADTVAAVRAPAGHPDHAILEANWQALRRARDQAGRRLTLVALPAPAPMFHDFPRGPRFGPRGRQPLPASYANFLIANGAVVVPLFAQAQDEQALRTLEQAMPGHKVIGVRAEHLIVGLGAFHCLSMQEPAVSPIA